MLLGVRHVRGHRADHVHAGRDGRPVRPEQRDLDPVSAEGVPVQRDQRVDRHGRQGVALPAEGRGVDRGLVAVGPATQDVPLRRGSVVGHTLHGRLDPGPAGRVRVPRGDQLREPEGRGHGGRRPGALVVRLLDGGGGVGIGVAPVRTPGAVMTSAPDASEVPANVPSWWPSPKSHWVKVTCSAAGGAWASRRPARSGWPRRARGRGRW